MDKQAEGSAPSDTNPDPVANATCEPARKSVTIPSVAIDPATFPDPPRGPKKLLPSTLGNFVHLLEAYGIDVRFNRMKKLPEVDLPGLDASFENKAAVTQTCIESLMIKHGLSTHNAANYILAVADSRRYDPFADWIDSKPWDGVDRLPAICATVVPAEGYPTGFANVLVLKWLLSVVAATFHGAGFHCRGILTFQGEQGLGKTSWFARLVSSKRLREEAVKLGHSWDGGNKDARIAAIGHRIVEWGELERSVRKELASLKSFTTDRTDKIRVPYARVASEYPRSTVFGASVNDGHFLIDSTGNSRFWTIPVVALDYRHEIDMQQVFAQLKQDYAKGDQWWLSPEEEDILSEINSAHEIGSVIGDKLAAELDLDRKGAKGLPRLRAVEVLERIGIDKPSNVQLKEANVALRSLLGPHKRIRGVNYWDIPWMPADRFRLLNEEY